MCGGDTWLRIKIKHVDMETEVCQTIQSLLTYNHGQNGGFLLQVQLLQQGILFFEMSSPEYGKRLIEAYMAT
jgi:hypothetical protein